MGGAACRPRATSGSRRPGGYKTPSQLTFILERAKRWNRLIKSQNHNLIRGRKNKNRYVGFLSYCTPSLAPLLQQPHPSSSFPAITADRPPRPPPPLDRNPYHAHTKHAHFNARWPQERSSEARWEKEEGNRHRKKYEVIFKNGEGGKGGKRGRRKGQKGEGEGAETIEERGGRQDIPVAVWAVTCDCLPRQTGPGKKTKDRGWGTEGDKCILG